MLIIREKVAREYAIPFALLPIDPAHRLMLVILAGNSESQFAAGIIGGGQILRCNLDSDRIQLRWRNRVVLERRSQRSCCAIVTSSGRKRRERERAQSRAGQQPETNVSSHALSSFLDDQALEPLGLWEGENNCAVLRTQQ